jgi:hypothetical protein
MALHRQVAPRLRMLSPFGVDRDNGSNMPLGYSLGLPRVFVRPAQLHNGAAIPGRVMHRGCPSIVSKVPRRDKSIVSHTRFIAGSSMASMSTLPGQGKR